MDHPHDGVNPGGPPPPAAPPVEFREDLLRGGFEIGEFIFKGLDRMKARRKAYHLAETSRLPHFYMGSTLCARKSTLLKWIAEQEANGARNAKRKKADDGTDGGGKASGGKDEKKPEDENRN
jgi:hypothetical protein